jgi:hypothetical protein
MAMDRQIVVIDITPLRVAGILHKTMESESSSGGDAASMEVNVPILKFALAEVPEEFELTRPILKKGDVANITHGFGIKAMKNKLIAASGVADGKPTVDKTAKAVQHLLK